MPNFNSLPSRRHRGQSHYKIRTQSLSGANSSLDDLVKRHILSVLAQTDGIIEGPKGAAKILGVHPNTLRSRMQKLGITRQPT